MNEDWRYSKEKLVLREQVLFVLMTKYGRELDSTMNPKYSTQSIYECAHDWVSQGNLKCDGIIEYYEENYHAKNN